MRDAAARIGLTERVSGLPAVSAPVSIAARVEAYLAVRRQVGFTLTIAGTELAAFARFADGLGHRGR